MFYSVSSTTYSAVIYLTCGVGEGFLRDVVSLEDLQRIRSLMCGDVVLLRSIEGEFGTIREWILRWRDEDV